MWCESTPVAIRRAHQFYGSLVTNSPEPASTGPRRSRDRLLHVALILFGVGIVGVIGIFLTPIVSDSKPGLWLYGLAMLAPAGFLLALIFALWSGRRAR